MSIGERVSIHRDCWFVANKEPSSKKEPELMIGSDCSIGMGTTISVAQRIEIGEFVLMGRNVYISDHRHAFEDVTEPIEAQGLADIRPVTIGKNSWLGQNVVILPGVTIGEHCVIGANSVVNVSIPDFSVAAGAPARIIKQYNPVEKCWQRAKAHA
jgi:acetyltransferase-like isoleucine patch superfamily enzyme